MSNSFDLFDFLYFLCKDIKNAINVVDSEGTGGVKKTLTINDKEGNPLSVDCMLSVSAKQVRL